MKSGGTIVQVRALACQTKWWCGQDFTQGMLRLSIITVRQEWDDSGHDLPAVLEEGRHQQGDLATGPDLPLWLSLRDEYIDDFRVGNSHAVPPFDVTTTARIAWCGRQSGMA